MSTPQMDGASPGWFARSSSNASGEEALPRHVPPGQRRSIDSTHSEAAVASPSSYGHRHSSPTQARSPDLDEARERQRTMDVESAMLLSRARSNTVTQPPPTHSPIFEQNDEVDGYPMLSRREEDEMTLARGEYDAGPSAAGFEYGVSETTIPTHLPESDAPVPLTSLVPEDDKQYAKPPLYSQPSSREHVDFSAMEEFAKQERVKLGLSVPSSSIGLDELRRRLQQKQRSAVPHVSGVDTTGQTPEPEGGDEQFNRARQRKLSQSHPKPRTRSAKLAMFENTPAPNFLPQSMSTGPSVTFDSTSPKANHSKGFGSERPFRFSFYSNTLSSTIHSRSVCELPAEGQSYEQLFYSGNPHPSSEFSGPAEQEASIRDRKSSYSQSRNALSIAAVEDIRTWWLDVLNPTDEEMRMFSKTFSIHPLTTEDILMEETREKIELFRHYYLVCFRGFDQDPYSPTYLEPVNMYIIVFREGILSFHFQSTPHALNVRRRIKQLKDYISVTSDWISYALIDDITDAFGPLIQSIEYEVDSIDELVLILNDAEQSDMLRRIGTCRKKVMGLLRLMGNKADVVKGLAKRCNENWSVAPKSDIGLYLSDIQDHLITMTQNLNHYEKILSRSHSNYLAQISIEMTEANNKINDVLSKLTAMGTVLIPMNLITGLWGMNVHVPGQYVDGFAWFASIVGALVGLAMLGGIVTYRIMTR